jgi:hypothetical protein
MNEETILFCPRCFQICESPTHEHDHETIRCEIGKIGDVRRKPIYDRNGRLLTRAPRWFLESIGWIEAEVE